LAWVWATAWTALALQVVEFGAGLWLMGAGWRYVCSVVFVPVFLVWKWALELRVVFGARREVWVRTARRPHA
jgi:hypothetical protein